MLFFNKKGVGIKPVVIMVLLIFALASMFGLVRLFGAASEPLTIRDICRTSVAVKARSIVLGIEDFPWYVGLKCPTVIIEVSKKGEGSIKDIIFGTKKKKRIGDIDFSVKSVKVEKGSDLKKAIADEMYDCWYKFGAGKLNFFGKFNVERRCLVCSVFEFKGKLKEASKIEGYENYLLKENIPGKSITYYDYFTKGKGLLFATDVETGDISIPTGDDLAIVYMVQQTGLAGLAGYKVKMSPIPFEDMPGECDVLE